MSIYKVDRKVDTVRIEMDIDVAEQLVEVLFLVQDGTRKGRSYQGSDLLELFGQLIAPNGAKVRFPSPLYSVSPTKDGVLLLNRI